LQLSPPVWSWYMCVAHARHECMPTLLPKVPVGQGEQPRALAADLNMPSGHCWHEPGEVKPQPAWYMPLAQLWLHALQLVEPTCFWNFPGAQSVQLLAPVPLWKRPAVHALQASCPTWSWNPPMAHVSQPVLPGALWNCPAGHALQWMLLPAAALNCPGSQSRHTRGVTAVAGAAWRWPAAQVACAVHTRSWYGVGCFDAHSLAEHVVCAVHVRSLCRPAAVVSHCTLLHIVCALHSRSLLGPGALVSNSLETHVVCAVHTRLVVVVGAWLS